MRLVSLHSLYGKATGFYECEMMPFGLTNASATLQRLVESCLGNLHLNYHIIYLDDIIIFSKTPSEHITRMSKISEKSAEAGLNLKPSRYYFFCTRLSYLGHIVSEGGIETDRKKVEVVKNWPTPTTVKDIRSILGLTNHYRCFTHKYAHIAKPLNLITTGENASNKKEKIEWNENCEVSFQKLKRALLQHSYFDLCRLL